MSDTNFISLGIDAQVAFDLAELIESSVSQRDLDRIEPSDPNTDAGEEFERLLAALRNQ